MKYKVNKFYRYKYSADDVVFQVRKIKEYSPKRVILSVYWLGSADEQELIIDKEDDVYEESN